MSLLSFFLRSRLLLIGLGLLALAWLPIELYIIFGPADGNPVGLGLLAWCATPFCFAMIGGGIVESLYRMRGSR